MTQSVKGTPDTDVVLIFSLQAVQTVSITWTKENCLELELMIFD